MLIRLLAYFVPFAINIMTGGFFFITAFRFAQAGVRGLTIGLCIAVWGISYCVLSMIVGRFAKPSNALPLILAGGSLMAAVSLGLAFCNVDMQFFWMMFAGLGAALFCTPFQLFAKSLSAGKKSSGAVEAAAFYTFTWSCGFATGALLFVRLSAQMGCFVCFGCAAAVIIGVIIIAQSLKKNPVAPIPQEQDGAAGGVTVSGRFAALACLGWIVGGAATIIASQIRGMWPKLGEELLLPQSSIAGVFALANFVQGFAGLLLFRSKRWMFRPGPALLLALLGVVSLLTFAFGRAMWSFYAAALGYGIYSGCLYFYLVYHSLAHPTRSNFYVAGNETVVGITNMTAPLLGGVLADCFQTAGAPFVFAAVIAVLTVGIQLFSYRLIQRKYGTF